MASPQSAPGSVPPRRLLCRLSQLSEASFPSCAGSVPLRRLLSRSSVSRLERAPSSGGMVPGSTAGSAL